MTKYSWPHLARLNENACRLATAAVEQAAQLGISLDQSGSHGRVIDFASDRTGTLAAGLELAKICLADLAEVTLLPLSSDSFSLPSIQVMTDSPIEACMGSQYAGWPLLVDEYFAMGSGPARALRGQEEVLEQYGLQHAGGPAVAVLETSKLPTDAIVAEVARQCQVHTSDVTLCVARTASLPGCVQVVARSVEVALHKLHELKFDLTTIKKASGVAPLPPLGQDDLTAMGWTNDAILYGGTVNLWVDTEDLAITSISEKIPGCSSSDVGEPFLDIFKRCEMDFYNIDKHLFSPAVMVINNVRTGNVFSYGRLRMDVLQKSFGSQLLDL